MQRIDVSQTVTSGGYKFKILSIHQVDNKLHVITKITTPNGASTSSMAHLADSVLVKTDTNEKLEVVHYLVNNKKNHRPYEIDGYQSITNEAEISELLAKGKCIYRRRFDHLRGLRLSQINAAREQSQQTSTLTFENASRSKTMPDTNHMLNIYPVVEKGRIKMVIETIARKENHYANEIASSLNHMSSMSQGDLSLRDDMLVMSDDSLAFEAKSSTGTSSFFTSAFEVYLPLNQPKKVVNFLLLLDAVVLHEMQKLNEHTIPYSHVQLSQQSILNSFDDLIIAKIFPYYDRSDAIIQNEMSISMETFLNKPGTLHQPDSITNILLTSILNLVNFPETEPLREYVKQFDAETIKELTLSLYLMSRLAGNYYPEVMNETNIPLANELDTLAMNKKNYNLLLPFIVGFKKWMSAQLVELAHFQGYKSSDLEVLLNAQYHMRDDGRMSFKLGENAAYEIHNIKNTADREKFLTELKLMTKSLKLELDSESDLNQEIIFTPESSAKLKIYGLHFNETNLHEQIRSQSTLSLQKPTKKLNSFEAEVVNILVKAGIYSESAFKLVMNSECKPVLEIMLKEKIFTDNIEKNKFLLANLMLVQRDYSLRHIYYFLGAHSGWLTPAIHNKLVRLSAIQQTEEMVNLIESNYTMIRQPMLDRLFSDPELYLNIMKLMGKWNGQNDLYLFLDSKIDHADVVKCYEALSYESKEWLSKETFGLLLTHIKDGPDVVLGFDKLQQKGLMATHRDRFLQNPGVAKAFRTLEEAGYLNNQNLLLCMENPMALSAAQAVKACRRMGIIYGNHQHIFSTFLENPALTNVVKELGQKGEKIQFSNRDAYLPIHHDLHSLLLSAGVIKKERELTSAFSSSVETGTTVFKAPTPMKLDELLKQLQEKYHLNENAEAPSLSRLTA